MKMIRNKAKHTLGVLLCVFLCILTLAAVVPVAGAESSLITTQEDFLKALGTAEEGDTLLVGDISFSCGALPTSWVTVRKSVTVRSGLDGNAVFSGVTMSVQGTDAEAIDVTFEGIDFRGDAYGDGHTPELPPDTSTIMHGQRAGYFAFSVNAVYRDCTFEGYHYTNGGALAGDGYSAAYKDSTLRLTLERCTFRDNFAMLGGAVYLCGKNNVILRARDCIFEENYAVGGGGVFAEGGDTVFFGCRFLRNGCLPKPDESEYGGGAICSRGNRCRLEGCALIGNVANDRGGAIDCSVYPQITLNATNCTLTGNRAPVAGAISVEALEPSLTLTPELESEWNGEGDALPSVAYLRFVSLADNGLVDTELPNTDRFACFFADTALSDTDPTPENGYCVTRRLDDARREEFALDRAHTVLSGAEYRLPAEALSDGRAHRFADTLAPLSVGDNYVEELPLILKGLPGQTGGGAILLRYGDTLELPTPERRGYRFVGWHDADGNRAEDGKIYLGGASNQLVLTAEWKWVFSEHLYLFLIPLLIAVLVLALIFFLRAKRKKEASREAATAETAGAEVGGEEILPDGWIDRVCEKPEVRGVLSKRELEVLRKLLEGKQRKQIAEELFISEATVRKHSTGIYSKLEAKNRTELLFKLTKLQ